jgi:hypothetical protein
VPFKSKAQRRKFAELLVNGKITDEAYERWNQTTGRKELPEPLLVAEKPRPGHVDARAPRFEDSAPGAEHVLEPIGIGAIRQRDHVTAIVFEHVHRRAVVTA